MQRDRSQVAEPHILKGIEGKMYPKRLVESNCCFYLEKEGREKDLI